MFVVTSHGPVQLCILIFSLFDFEGLQVGFFLSRVCNIGVGDRKNSGFCGPMKN